MIEFEPAQPSDAEELAEVSKRTFEDDAERFFGHRGGPPGYDSLEYQRGAMERASYYKILEDGRIVGGIIVFDLGHRDYALGRIWVDTARQNRGIGKLAMAFLDERYPDARSWRLTTPEWAVRDHHFYESFGFRRAGSRPDHEGKFLLVEYVRP